MSTKVTVRVLVGFWDRVAKVHRTIGEEFDVTKDRADHIASVLPGYIEVVENPTVEPVEPAEPTPDLAGLKMHELTAMCRERGIKVPRGAKKSDIIALLEG